MHFVGLLILDRVRLDVLILHIDSSQEKAAIVFSVFSFSDFVGIVLIDKCNGACLVCAVSLMLAQRLLSSAVLIFVSTRSCASPICVVVRRL